MSTAGGKVPLPIVNEVEGWTEMEELINFLCTQGLDLKDNHFDILCEQEINGISFFELNADKLVKVGLKLGPAETITKLIEKIKGEGQVNEVEGWTEMEELINFLHTQGLGLKDNHFDILCEQEINGVSFLELNADKLIKVGLKLGLAETIAKLIKKIKGEGQDRTSSITNEIVTKIDTILEKLTEEKTETVLFSSINQEKFNRLLTCAGLDIILLTFTKKWSSKDIVAYQWSNHAESFSEQLGSLNKHLNPYFPEDIMVFDVSGSRNLLNEGAVRGKIPIAGIHAVIELKKDVKSYHVPQIICEIILADLHIHDGIKVFEVLTDLNETWNIYWLEEKHIKTLALNHRENALRLIGKMASENSSKVDVRGFPTIQCTKFKYIYGLPINDIEEMNILCDAEDESDILKDAL
ncbi:28788_t:CDS:2 [Gigaspora margarita]|uniref:28788_t:CDS:1 n=1 Tax=Gigaspora margarita TaxID=4874 RepID=A0ABN7UHY7_GIGMA|nr:28788_t:CDS:2 [Gigaspora margarita]